MYLSGSSHHMLCETDEPEVTKVFGHMRESLQQRLAVLYRADRYLLEQYHETLKKYRRLVAGELAVETDRYNFDRLLVGHLAKCSRLTKQMQGYSYPRSGCLQSSALMRSRV